MPRWPVVFNYLTKQRLETISPETAKSRVDAGEWVLVDVRLGEQYEAGHAEGAVSAPIYETIGFQGSDFRRLLKVAMYKSNGVNPVDPNPKFAEQLRAASGGKGVILMCEAGGTMKPTTNFPEGKPSRSLQAAYRAVKEGLAPKVAHLERGVYGWYQASLPMEGDYQPELGRTPMAAAEPTLQRITEEKGYETRPGDKAVETKKNWPFF